MFHRLLHLLATWFGCGYARIAPGTFGSLGALPLFALLSFYKFPIYILFLVTLTLVGTLAADRVAHRYQQEDPSFVVIDEVVGTLIALGIIRNHGYWAWILAFILFRIFDITKPGLIDRSQRLKPWGVGIMADDVLAGLLAGTVTLGLAELPQWIGH